MDLLASLPKGDALAELAWNSRHRGILSILWLHVLGVPMFGVYIGARPSLYLGEGALLAFIAVSARLSVVRHRLQSAIATCGLMTASALLCPSSCCTRIGFRFSSDCNVSSSITGGGHAHARHGVRTCPRAHTPWTWFKISADRSTSPRRSRRRTGSMPPLTMATRQ